MEIRNLLESGVSVSEAARILGVARSTIRKYAQAPFFPEYVRRKKNGSKLEPYKEYIKGRLEKYPLSGVRIYDEIKALGYQGQMTILRDFIRELKHEKEYHAVKIFAVCHNFMAELEEDTPQELIGLQEIILSDYDHQFRISGNNLDDINIMPGQLLQSKDDKTRSVEHVLIESY